jgi:hypothetical protein
VHKGDEDGPQVIASQTPSYLKMMAAHPTVRAPQYILRPAGILVHLSAGTEELPPSHLYLLMT